MSLVDCLVGTISSQNQIYMSPSYLFLYPVFFFDQLSLSGFY